MLWFRAHPYASALGVAGFLVLLGTFIVNDRSTETPSGTILAWGGLGAAPSTVQSSAHNTTAQTSNNLMQPVQNLPPYAYTSPLTNTNSSTAVEDSFDFDGFVAMLSAQSRSASGGSQSTNGQQLSAYAFIPTGLITSPTSQKSYTPLQRSIYDYGNDVGSFIQSFTAEHGNMAQVLKNQIEDRNNSVKAEAVVSLGRSLTALGDSMLTIDTVPASFVPTHQALARSYQELGAKLSLVPKAEGNAAFIAAIETYNASADSFTKKFVALADLFVTYGVSFSNTDAGSVFTFTGISF